MYDSTTVRPYKVPLLTCVVNCTAGTPTPRLCPVVQWSVHWAPSRTTWVLVLVGARRCALETCGKKNASTAFRAWLNLCIILSHVQALLQIQCTFYIRTNGGIYGLNELKKKKKRNHSERELFKKSIGWLAVLIYYHWVPFSTGSSRLKRPSVTPKRELAIFSLTIIDQC